MIKKCIKCKHVNSDWGGSEAEICPACGDIYGNVPASAQATRARPSALDDASFLKRLRAESHYPAFRTVVSLLTLLGYVVALIFLLVAAFAAVSTRQPLAALGGVASAVLIAVCAKVLKEASLMMADLSDATVRLARRQEAAGE